MKKYLIIALLPFFFYACSVDIWEDVRAEKNESESFSSRQIQRVEAKTKNGSIESTTWDEDSIQIDFEKWATGHDIEDAEDKIDDIKVRINEYTDSGVLSIDVDYPQRFGTGYGCNIYISLPSNLSLDLETSNGAITVLESQSDIKCSTSNGAITIQDTEGNADLRTSNGKITVINHYGELSGKTSNGQINADVTLPRQGECILKTSNGPITLSIPGKTSATIEASTSNGRIEVEDLDVTVIEMEKTEFKGKLGKGEGSIDLETSNGTILVKGSL